VPEECGHGRTVPKKNGGGYFFLPRSIVAFAGAGESQALREVIEPTAA
jgi:hypothetical protein